MIGAGMASGAGLKAKANKSDWATSNREFPFPGTEKERKPVACSVTGQQIVWVSDKLSSRKHETYPS